MSPLAALPMHTHKLTYTATKGKEISRIPQNVMLSSIAAMGHCIFKMFTYFSVKEFVFHLYKKCFYLFVFYCFIIFFLKGMVTTNVHTYRNVER